MTVTYVSAIISPSQGKEKRVQELLQAIVDHAEQNEKGTTRYVLTKAVDSTDFIVSETYESNDAFESHKATKPFQDFAKEAQEQGLVSKQPVIIASEKISGFDSR